MNNPIRVQRKRAKGWKLPDHTVCVDRSTKWGNPFIVSKHGTQAECLEFFEIMCSGYVVIGEGIIEQQEKFHLQLENNLEELRGKNLACWCRDGTPCHADVLLKLANPEFTLKMSEF